LRSFFEKGDKKGIQPHHAAKLTRQLRRLDEAASPSDMNITGWKLHPLHGNEQGLFSVWVSSSWRLTFQFESSNAVFVDYRDYH
jgi:proteic killer suppression protein